MQLKRKIFDCVIICPCEKKMNGMQRVTILFNFSKRKVLNTLFCGLILANLTVFGQETLSLQKAVAMGLKNNYSIQIMAKQLEIAESNNSLGNAGFLPSLGLDGGISGSNNSVYQKYHDGRIIETDGVSTTGISSSLMLNWTMFDGFKMFVDKRILESQTEAGKLQLKAQAEFTIATIITLYTNLIQQKKQLAILDSALLFSIKRLQIAQRKYETGSWSKFAFQQALIDLNNDSANWIKQKVNLENTRSNLNMQLALPLEKEFLLTDSIAMENLLSYPELLQSTLKWNTQLQLSRITGQISDLNRKAAQSGYYPKIGAYAAYNLSHSVSDAGSLKTSQSYGPAFGLNLSYTIFDGFETNRNLFNAQKRIEIATLEMQWLEMETCSILQQTYQEYLGQLKILDYEEKNLSFASENARIALGKYSLGAISDVELRQLQLQQLQAETKYVSALQWIKNLETELKRMSGLLVKTEE